MLRWALGDKWKQALLLCLAHLLHFAVETLLLSVLAYNFASSHGYQSHQGRRREGDTICTLSRHGEGTESERRGTETWGRTETQRKRKKPRAEGRKDPKSEEQRLRKEETKTQREGDRNPNREGDKDQEWGMETQTGVSGTQRERGRHPELEADQSAREKENHRKKQNKFSAEQVSGAKPERDAESPFHRIPNWGMPPHLPAARERCQTNWGET